MPVPTKREHYENLIARLDEAVESEYFLEAAWIEYVIIEDRLSAAIKLIGLEPVRMLGPKLGQLDDAKENSLALKEAFYDDLLDRIDNWKGSNTIQGRNFLMHQMAEEAMSIDEFQSLCQDIASRGAVIVRDLCNAIQRLKKRIKANRI